MDNDTISMCWKGPFRSNYAFQIPKIGASSVDLVVRAKMPLPALVSGVRSTLKQVDPTLPTAEFQTLGQIVDRAVSPKRLITLLLSGFSWLALILASLGIYGVISYSVSQRTHEIGIRLAIGAPGAAVLKLVIGQGMKLAGIGVTIGLIASLGLMRVMKTLLFGVSTTDPLTFVTNALLLSAVALLACYLPARRAARVDPMEALRCE